jgi:hypothetical protein
LPEGAAPRVTGRELATILAALRFHQAENLQGGRTISDQFVREIATDGGVRDPLDCQEIDKLCERLNVCPRRRPTGMVIDPPPAEDGQEPLFRVVYAIDVSTTDPLAAARQAHRVMADDDSLPPVLDVMDHNGKVVRVDLSAR